MDADSSIIFDMYRGTSHDGPGLRTTLFFKGCTLRCAWCHNPEGIAAEPEIWWDMRKCIGCLDCVKACGQEALTAAEDGIRTNMERCVNCGACVKACPTQARSYTGEAWEPEKLLREAMKDKPYYTAFGGGVTASGGEPLMQVRQVRALFEQLHAAGVHTALDTCGNVPWESFALVLPVTDCVLYDVKLFDPAAHKRYTGVDNKQILENLRKLAAYMRMVRPNLQLWIRTPLIPEATATEENLSAIGGFLNSELGDLVERWELCAFNNVCITKYRKMGRAWMFENEALLKQSVVDKLKQSALRTGFSEERMVVSGIIAK